MFYSAAQIGVKIEVQLDAKENYCNIVRINKNVNNSTWQNFILSIKFQIEY